MQIKLALKSAWLALAALALDRVTKQLVLRLIPYGSAHSALAGLISWAHVTNEGVAFSGLSGNALLIIFLSALLLVGVLARLIMRPKDKLSVRAGLWLILGGGLGNLWDRLAYGHVIDFIRCDFVDFPVFNLADVFICAGALLIAIAVLRAPKPSNQS